MSTFIVRPASGDPLRAMVYRGKLCCYVHPMPFATAVRLCKDLCADDPTREPAERERWLDTWRALNLKGPQL